MFLNDILILQFALRQNPKDLLNISKNNYVIYNTMPYFCIKSPSTK